MEFTVSSTVLKLKGGLAESSFQRARKELVKRGLVEYRSRGQNLAPAYRMMRLYREVDGVRGNDGRDPEVEGQTGQVSVQEGPRGTGQMEGQMNHQAEGQVDRRAEALIKLKEIKPKETKQEVDAFVFYQENFGVVSPLVSEDILGWIGDVGEELVMGGNETVAGEESENLGICEGDFEVMGATRDWDRGCCSSG